MASSASEGDGTGSPPQDFIWSQAPEPHAARRKAILAAHPEIKELYGPCPRTKYVCAALVIGQLALTYALKDAPWWLLIVLGYAVGGVINHALLLAIHELSHNLAFRKPLHNRLFALFVNLPIGLPVAATFRYYHLLHHTHQGKDGVDTDLPTQAEGRFLKGAPVKLFWVILQGFAYALRPLFVHPKRPSGWELLNFAVQFAFNVAIVYFWGWKALLFLPISSFLAMGLHPVAGHYISEHYVFSGNQETYSYYGPLNWLTFNVGYHNEHHDFPYVPGSRLPQVKHLATEHYDNLHAYQSWTGVLWRYITDAKVGAFSRVKRRNT